MKVLSAEITVLRESIRGATIKHRDEWERIEDHAERASVQRQTVRPWTRLGKIGPKRIGNVTYVRG
ncbi:hypothetical protein DL1_03135 [Thioclava dalianensis]|uniref:Uncharacterized protein n=1 Tax=Thioclava dalianensis TaxID=1185766 RepID=A0A074TKX1_9RHOB|nr:hypothetical protein [Thioclava dalianensis]KEP69643.1 hypothetical protein DL1_03135 [Thioclava dalianensis]SFN15552.1 hypothetical protein SAMN05216224_102690 [Thioclava dalianensis]